MANIPYSGGGLGGAIFNATRGKSTSSSNAKPTGASATQRYNTARTKALTAQGKAYKDAGMLSRDGKTWYGAPDPNAALEAWLAAHDSEGGGGGGGGGYGGGGGGGGWDGYGMAVSNATARYNDQQGQLNDLYGDYLKAIEGNPAATKAMYAALINDSAAAGKGIQDAAAARADASTKARNAALTSLGVSQEAIDASPSLENEAVAKGATNLAQQNSSWGNLQGVLGAAQESRDRLDIQGVNDAKTLAQRQLSQNYEDFMRQLDAQLMASMAGGGGGGGSRGGGGGGSSSGTNKYRTKMEDAIFDQLLTAAGYKGKQETKAAPSRPSTNTTVTYDSRGNVTGKKVTTTRK